MITPNATRNCPQMSDVTCGKYERRQGFWAVIRTLEAVRPNRTRQRLAVVIITAQLPDTVWPALRGTRKPGERLERLCLRKGEQCDGQGDRQFRSIHDRLKIMRSVT